jgi:hypothetical protein
MISSLYQKLFEKLPVMAKVIFVMLAIVGSVYSISQIGLASFLLRVILSP